MRPQKGKQKIFESAMTLFEQQGYFATTIAQITQQAGVSKGLVYNYFDSKAALLLGLLENATQKMQGNAQILSAEKGVEVSLAEFLDGFFAFLVKEKRFLKLQLTLMLTPELNDIVKQSVSARAELLLNIVQHWLTELQKPDAEQKARLFIALLDGVALHYLSIYEDYPLSSLQQPIQASLLKLIA